MFVNFLFIDFFGEPDCAEFFVNFDSDRCRKCQIEARHGVKTVGIEDFEVTQSESFEEK